MNQISAATNYIMYARQQMEKLDRAKGQCRILIVEDDPFSSKLFNNILNSKYNKIQIISACNLHEANKALAKYRYFDLILLDIYLGDRSLGVDFYLKLLKLQPKPVVIMTSAIESDEYTKMFPPDVAPPPFLHKPFRAQQCLDLVELFTEGGLR